LERPVSTGGKEEGREKEERGLILIGWDVE
jgi:hypothetical protein